MKDIYNSATSLSFDEFADFVAVHYALTQREDTPYWRDNFNRSYDLVGSGNFDKYGLTAFSRELYKFSSYNNLNSGFHYIASGMNVSSYTKIKCDTNTVEVNALQWRSVVETLPSLYDFLMKIH